MDFSYLKAHSQTAYDSVSGIQAKVQNKVANSYEDQDKKTHNQFDITKLESIKEKTNKNFFEKMETLKSTKKTTVSHGNGQDKDVGDLLDLDTGNNQKPTDNGDLINLDVDNSPMKQPSKPTNGYGDLDLLASEDKPKAQKSKNDDFLIDFQQDLTISKPADKKTGDLLDSDLLSDMNIKPKVDTKPNNKESKPEPQSKDPFDFIAF